MAPSPWRTERHPIKCCHHCKPPKRYPGCSDHCPEYKKEKAQHELEKQREKEYKQNNRVLTNYDFNKLN